ncbi:hypothetical protein N7510_005855 [Penicillium lagena]|uniref:uncharacterized protein n=1 Tax=Penicillium lagena TaxID=94218 RepID=UPI00253F6996|nr:uncharacterized protein N7510_005855 [Penicillium lagena]KAJ5612661.1 hypothetical protein N7510_005855 [Penicillium lagena]
MYFNIDNMAIETYDFTIRSHFPASKFDSISYSPKEFLSQRFHGDVSADLAQEVSTHLDQAGVRDSPMGIIEIERYTPAIAHALLISLPEFPGHLLEKVVLNTSSNRNLSEIPSANKDSTSIVSLLNFPSSAESSHVHGSTTGNFYQIAIWIRQVSVTSQTVGDSDHHGTTNIWLICTSPNVRTRLAKHYFSGENPKRWVRLHKHPLWIFADILHVFGDWAQIWDAIKEKLTPYHDKILLASHVPTLLELTRDLHHETATLLLVREQLRVHSAALTRLLHLGARPTSQDPTERKQDPTERRLQVHLEDIKYHEETSQDISRQLENMINLVASPDFPLSTLSTLSTNKLSKSGL